MASPSQPEVGWQPNFQLGDKPLPANAIVRLWAQGEGGRVAQSLVRDILLPKDDRFYSDGGDESLARWL